MIFNSHCDAVMDGPLAAKSKVGAGEVFFFFYPDERSLLVAEIKSSSGADVSFSPPVSRLC